jgi:hypothetical protein
MQIQPANSDPVDDFKAELPLLLFSSNPTASALLKSKIIAFSSVNGSNHALNLVAMT